MELYDYPLLPNFTKLLERFQKQQLQRQFKSIGRALMHRLDSLRLRLSCNPATSSDRRRLPQILQFIFLLVFDTRQRRIILFSLTPMEHT